MEKNSSLCRTYLSEIDQVDVSVQNIEYRDMWWFQVRGITNFAQKLPDRQLLEIVRSFLGSCMIPFCDVGILIVGNRQDGIHFFLGITDDEDLSSAFRSSCIANFPGIELAMERADYGSLQVGRAKGGVMVGIPCQQSNDKEDVISGRMPVDKLLSGMNGKNFSLLVLAERQPEMMIDRAIPKIEGLVMENSMLLTSNRTSEAGLQIKYENIEAQRYQNNLTKLQDMLYGGTQSGLWSVSVIYSCDSEMDLLALKNCLVSGYAGTGNERFEQLRCIDLVSGTEFLNRNPAFLTLPDPRRGEHPLNKVAGQEEYYQYLLQTFMNSQGLAHYFLFPKQEVKDFYIDEYVAFDVMMRRRPTEEAVRIGNIIMAGKGEDGSPPNYYEIPLKDLDRHALVIGATGGGKTNTMKVLLSEIWRKNRIPFLVIESAKREYIELLQVMPLKGAAAQFDMLNVFTLGNETEQGIRYRINPFEVMPGIALQTHIDYLLSTFNAAFEMYAPMPYVLERAVYEIYEDKGWDLFSGGNRRGLKEFPTLSHLYYKIDTVVNRMGYDNEVKSNVKAALKARINSLRIGGKGALLDVGRSIPIQSILAEPCIFELEDIGDDDTKAFVIGILLVQLYEYRKTQGTSSCLKGVMVVEEAHRLLKSVPETEGGNARTKAVEFFCNMLAEIRSFGQGIIIADQIPTKLASDTIKNTNLKIVHRTLTEEDRNCIGAAMHMTPEQIDYLNSLYRGCAAVYSEGDNRPKLVKMPLVQTVEGDGRQSMVAMLRRRAEEKLSEYYREDKKKHTACLYCENRNCPNSNLMQLIEEFDIEDYRGVQVSTADITALVHRFEKNFRLPELNEVQSICLMGFLLQRTEVEEEKQAEIIVEALKKFYPWRR